MKDLNVIRFVLALFGLIGLLIGGALLFVPIAFEASAGVVVHPEVNLLSEFRAFGGLLLVGGVVIVLGALYSRFTHLSLLTAALVYGSIGLSRVVGMLIDGIPSSSLISATTVEVAIALISLAFLVRLKFKLKAMQLDEG